MGCEGGMVSEVTIAGWWLVWAQWPYVNARYSANVFEHVINPQM